MRRFGCLWIFAWMAILPDVGLADPPDPSPPDPPQQVSLLRQSPLAKFYLHLGRPQIDPIHYRKGSQSQLLSPDHALGHTLGQPLDQSLGQSQAVLQETLRTTSTRGTPTMHYTLVGHQTRVMIDVTSTGTWTIDSQRDVGSDRQRLHLTQAIGRPIVLTMESTALPTLELRAATWLHLREADRLAFDTHLLPLIQQLIAPYRFEQLAEQSHEKAIESEQGAVIDEQSVAELIDQLRSSNRQQRVQACQELRSLGIELLPLLAELDRSRLDAEQRARVLWLERTISPHREDSPERLAALLRRDSTYWQLASTRLSDRERSLIATRFQQAGMKSPIPDQEHGARVANLARD